jgi:hypothetical protein
MPFAVFGISRVALALSLTMALTSFAQMKAGERRQAYGEVRASIIESVLTTLYPNAHVQWEPDLTVQMPGQEARRVQVPVYVRGNADGGLEGVASVELDGEKERFIFDARGFSRTEHPPFSTIVIAFRANTSGHIERAKRILLDPNEPLTEIKTLSIQDWSQQEWPVLEVQYDTHRSAAGSFATIEWHAIFDVNSSRFINRLPFGISRRVKGGPEQSYGFSIIRNSPTTLLITDHIGGTAHPYDCSDPCVVDANRLVSQWIH